MKHAPMLIVAWRLMTSGDSGFSSAGLSVARSCVARPCCSSDSACAMTTAVLGAAERRLAARRSQSQRKSDGARFVAARLFARPSCSTLCEAPRTSRIMFHARSKKQQPKELPSWRQQLEDAPPKPRDVDVGSTSVVRGRRRQQ